VRINVGLDIVGTQPLEGYYAAGGVFVQGETFWVVQPRIGLQLDWVSRL
jgi:hypothetical protein